ncbi:MAG TPA: hypothetical protein VIL46_08240, partial [Gemmataceae bacterium]
GRIVAPVPSIPTPENQSFFGKLYERIASLFPFAPRISAGPQTGWFPSLRRRNVERHRWPDWQLE